MSSSPPQTQVPSSQDLGPLPPPHHTTGYHSEQVSVDPDVIFSPDEKLDTLSLLKEFDRVFDPVISGYNGAACPIEGVVNIGPVQPPQRKDRTPQYARGQLEQLQTKFEELGQTGVFQRPEDLTVVPEYLNTSFLVKKRVVAFAWLPPSPMLADTVNPNPS
jgi:hypothetical protein